MRDAGPHASAADSFDLLTSTVNVPLDWDALLATLRRRGRLHVLGAVPEPLTFPMQSLMMIQRSVGSSLAGRPSDIAEMLEFAGRHGIQPVTETFSFDQINDAVDHLRDGKARYRVVLEHQAADESTGARGMSTEEQRTAPTARGWFRGPPRAHGEVLDDRTVSFLELFYDLVFVVLIAQIAHTLAGDVSWVGVRNFAIVFALIWIAWTNGTFYHELHGREDGRSRSYIFAQMTLLALLAVYASHAADSVTDGRGFAIVYALLLSFIAWQWLGVRNHDTAEMAALTLRYVIGMSIPIGLVAVSAVIDTPNTRRVLWTVAIAVTIVGLAAQVFRPDQALEDAFRVTESTAERFGLLTIIVLGEVVVGVVDGLSEAERNGRTVATGVISLTIGFGFWWNYFDFVGRRPPRPGALTRGIWNLGHLPMWLSVAAAGAGIVSLVEHANDSRTPTATAWLVTASTAALALSLAAIASTMPTHPGRRMVPVTLTAAAAIAMLLGALRPSPIILATALAATLSLVWVEAFARHLRTGSAIGAS